MRATAPPPSTRRRLSRRRKGYTTSFVVGGAEFYLTVGLFEDDSPGEVFLKHGKQGSMTMGLLDAVSILLSLALQSGVPLTTLVDKFAGARYEPMGLTDDPEIPYATSPLDYVIRRLALNHGD